MSHFPPEPGDGPDHAPLPQHDHASPQQDAEQQWRELTEQLQQQRLGQPWVKVAIYLILLLFAMTVIGMIVSLWV